MSKISIRSINDSNKNWYVIDATDVVLGRLALVAHMLKGKHKPQYQPHGRRRLYNCYQRKKN